MTNEEAIKFLSQIKDALLASNSWLPSTHNPIKESFGMAINALTAQPETHEERTETHACDLIERQAAIDAVRRSEALDRAFGYGHAVDALRELPSAEPEIIRCGQCKYAEVADKEDAQDGYTCQFHRGSVWFSGSYCSWAERRTDG